MIKQIIIRSKPTTGYKIILNNMDNDVDSISDDLLAELVPKSANKRRINYFSKENFENEVLVKLVCENDLDEYDRPIAKSHCMIIPEEEYINKGLLFFISPILNENQKLLKDKLLEIDTDFQAKSLRISTAVKKLLQAILLYQQVFIFTPKANNSEMIQLYELIAGIEELLPYNLSRSLKIKSYVTNHHFDDINIGITDDEDIFEDKKINQRDMIIFTVKSTPYLIEADEELLIRPLIDDVVNTVLNPFHTTDETLESLYESIFATDKDLDPRIDYVFKDKVISRWNIKKNRSYTLKKLLKKNFSRSPPKPLS